MKLDLKLNYQSSSKRKENISRAHFSVVFNQHTPNAPLRKEGLFFFGGEQMLCKWSSRTNTKKNAVLGKQLRYHLKTNQNPAGHSTANTFVYLTFSLRICISRKAKEIPTLLGFWVIWLWWVPKMLKNSFCIDQNYVWTDKETILEHSSGLTQYWKLFSKLLANKAYNFFFPPHKKYCF